MLGREYNNIGQRKLGINGLIVIMGAHLPCKEEVRVRIPVGPPKKREGIVASKQHFHICPKCRIEIVCIRCDKPRSPTAYCYEHSKSVLFDTISSDWDGIVIYK